MVGNFSSGASKFWWERLALQWRVFPVQARQGPFGPLQAKAQIMRAGLQSAEQSNCHAPLRHC